MIYISNIRPMLDGFWTDSFVTRTRAGKIMHIPIDLLFTNTTARKQVIAWSGVEWPDELEENIVSYFASQLKKRTPIWKTSWKTEKLPDRREISAVNFSSNGIFLRCFSGSFHEVHYIEVRLYTEIVFLLPNDLQTLTATLMLGSLSLYLLDVGDVMVYSTAGVKHVDSHVCQCEAQSRLIYWTPKTRYLVFPLVKYLVFPLTRYFVFPVTR